MARTPVKERAPEDAHVMAIQDAATEAESTAHELARQLQYEGTLAVGALEDEIRFYQRRSVEALLETGKRLLLLKELTPHSEFVSRVEMLGFHIRTAQRFMQAAAKVAKNDTVSLLATQVKNQKAFLELVTHDDDADIERVAEMDGIDRMSASELRSALRDVQADKQATEEVLADVNARLAKAKAAANRIAHAPLETRIAADMEELTERGLTAMSYLRGDLRMAFRHMFDLEQEGLAPAGAHRQVMAGWVREMENELQALKSEFFLLEVEPVNVRADLDALVAKSAVQAD